MRELYSELIFLRPFILLFLMFSVSFVSGNTKSFMKGVILDYQISVLLPGTCGEIP